MTAQRGDFGRFADAALLLVLNLANCPTPKQAMAHVLEAVLAGCPAADAKAAHEQWERQYAASVQVVGT